MTQNKSRRGHYNRKPVIVKLGTRKIAKQNFSFIITIPHEYIINAFNGKAEEVDVTWDVRNKLLIIRPHVKRKNSKEKSH